MELCSVEPEGDSRIADFRITIHDQVLIEEDWTARVNTGRGGERPTAQDHIDGFRRVFKEPAPFAYREIPAQVARYALSRRIGVAPFKPARVGRQVIEKFLRLLSLVCVSKHHAQSIGERPLRLNLERVQVLSPARRVRLIDYAVLRVGPQ